MTIPRHRLRKTVMAALVAEMLVSLGASAQTADRPAIDPSATVVVSGIRASLSSSLTTKRMQGGVVDAVSAEDAGKFPDTNIAESLQRVTGVQIQRNGGEGATSAGAGWGRSSTMCWSTAAP